MTVVFYWILVALLVYSYVGYPVLVGILGKLARARQRPSGAACRPHVTLIVPAYNEEEIIRQKIQNSLELDYPSGLLDVVVVDDGSSDNTAQFASSFESDMLQVFRHNSRRGKASAINSGVNTAKGSILCLCDANVLLCRDALTRLVERIAEPNVGAVTGLVLLDSRGSDFGSGEELFYRVERWIHNNEEGIGSLTSVDGGMYIVKAELLEPIPADTILDDLHVSAGVIRQGYRIRYEQSAIARETGTPTGRHEFNRRARIAAGYIQALRRGIAPSWRRPLLFWQFVSHKLLRWAGPLLLVGLLVINANVAQHGIIYAATLIGQIALYASGALGSCFTRFRRTWLGELTYYFTLSQCAIAIGLINGVMNRQSVAWAKADRDLRSIATVDNVSGGSMG